jgi:hypothetical protein
MPACVLCRREGGKLTTHHLMPHAWHKNRKNPKDGTRAGVKGRPVALCRSCHQQVHLLTTKEAQHYF